MKYTPSVFLLIISLYLVTGCIKNNPEPKDSLIPLKCDLIGLDQQT
jgi:hypothetical protein